MACHDEHVTRALVVLLVDPLALALRGLRSLLGEFPLISQVVEARDTGEAMVKMRDLGEGIALVSHRPPRLDAFALLRMMRDERLGFRMAIIGSHLGTRNVLDALRLDVEALLDEDMSPEAMSGCIEALRSGARWLDEKVLRDAVQDPEAVARVAASLSGLTRRQTEIAVLVSLGLSNKQIACDLNITEGTVKLQMHRIFKRTGHRNRAMLASAVTLQNAASGSNPLHDTAKPEPQLSV